MMNQAAPEMKPVTNRQMLRSLYHKLMKRDKGILGLCILYTFFMSVYPLLAVYLPGLLIGRIETAVALGPWEAGRMPEAIRPVAYGMLLILVSYFALSALFGFMSRYLSNHSYSRIAYLRLDYIRDTVHKVMTMDFLYFEHASFMDRVDRVNRATQGNNVGVEEVYRQLFMMPATLISILLVLIVLASASPILLILPIVSFVLMLWALNRSDLYAFELRDERSHAGRRLMSYNRIAQDFTYGKDIRLFSLERSIFSAYRQMADAFIQIVTKTANKRTRYLMLPLLSQVLMGLVVLVVLVLRALRGEIGIAAVSVYLAAYTSASLLLDEFAKNLIRTVSEARYVKELLGFLKLDLNTSGGSVTLGETEALTVEFEDVSFSYPGTDTLVLENLNLRIEAGEKLALVGINGAGKTSLTKLLTGLHHPTSGRVLINGVDTRELLQSDLFRRFSVVFQESRPISFTVAEHVAACRDEIDRVRVEAALRRSGLWDKIEASGGIDQTLLKMIDPDGLMLSGGETQKLMMARAIYKDAPVVILDEPTSALDALAESRVYQDFSDLMLGKTALFISHRLASTSFCDRIVLLSGGLIAESGTHEELMQARGTYYDMYRTQGKYYRTDDLEQGDDWEETEDGQG